MTADPLNLVRLVRDVAADVVRPLADDFGDGVAATVEAGYASIRKGGLAGLPTAGFFIVPGLDVVPGDHVFYLDRGAFKLVVLNLSRAGYLPDEVTLTDLILAGTLTRTGILSPPALTANTNDWAPDGWADASIIRLDQTAAFNLTGMLPGPERDLVNVSAFNCTLKHDVTSTAASRFYGAGGDFILVPNASARCWYDGISVRWRILAK